MAVLPAGLSETAAILYSLIGTGRLNQIDPQAYLRHVLERIATSRPLAAVPDGFRRSMPKN